MAEPIGSKFCVGHHVTPGKVCVMKILEMCLQKNLIFIKFLKSTNFFFNPQTFFVLFPNLYNEKMFTIEFEDFAPILKPISVVIHIPVYIQRQLDTVDSV